MDRCVKDEDRQFVDGLTSWTELQHCISPVLQLSRRTGVADAERARAKRERTAVRANIVNVRVGGFVKRVTGECLLRGKDETREDANWEDAMRSL